MSPPPNPGGPSAFSRLTSFTLLCGENPVTQYGTFGIANKRMIPRPSKLLGFLFGPTNSGKTSLVASAAGALIINLEKSSTPISSPTAPPLPAQFWPGLNEDGQPIDPSGKVFRVDWDSVKTLINSLVEASQKNLPRPDFVVFDSLTTLIYSVLHEATLKNFGKDEWAEGRGDAMWEWLNQQIAWAIRSLRDANYGVWFIGHLATYENKGTDGASSQKTYIQCHPGFIRRFWGQFELCIGIEKTLSIEVTPYEEEVKMSDGKIAKVTKQRQTQKVGFVLTGETPKTATIYRQRIALPKAILLPEVGGWVEFEKQYLSVAKLPIAQAPNPAGV